jgi:hypothetical protein
MKVSRSVLFGMLNISGTARREHKKLFSMGFFPQNRAVNIKMLKNMVEPERPQMTIWRMRISC